MRRPKNNDDLRAMYGSPKVTLPQPYGSLYFDEDYVEWLETIIVAAKIKVAAKQQTTLRIILKRDKTDNEHYSFTASE